MYLNTVDNTGPLENIVVFGHGKLYMLVSSTAKP